MEKDGDRREVPLDTVGERARSGCIFVVVRCLFRVFQVIKPKHVEARDRFEASRQLKATYKRTAKWYDLLDQPWERIYREWRPELAGDMEGDVLEMGIGTGNNIPYYPADCRLLGIDLSEAMLDQCRANMEGHKAPRCKIVGLEQADACDCRNVVPDKSQDWLLATFVFCPMPDVSQPDAIREIARVLRPGGRYRILEMVYSKDKKKRKNMNRAQYFVQWMYGASFDRHTVKFCQEEPGLDDMKVSFIKGDVYLLIEGRAILDPWTTVGVP